jgi:hypothetical protein
MPKLRLKYCFTREAYPLYNRSHCHHRHRPPRIHLQLQSLHRQSDLPLFDLGWSYWASSSLSASASSVWAQRCKHLKDLEDFRVVECPNFKTDPQPHLNALAHIDNLSRYQGSPLLCDSPHSNLSVRCECWSEVLVLHSTDTDPCCFRIRT